MRPPPPDEDLTRLVHELRVHQIELEMQNEELQRVRNELEQGLSRYTDLYDFAPVGYVTLGKDGTIRKVNLTGARLLHVERSKLLGTRLDRLVAPSCKQTVRAFIHQVGESCTLQSCEATLQADAPAPAEVQLEGIVTQGSEELRIIVMDISEKKRLLAQLFQSQKMESVGLLAGGIAHDFNNILAALSLCLSLAQEDAPAQPPDLRESLKDSVDLVERAADLTRQLLSYSRRQVMVRGRHDLNDIVADGFRLLRRLVREDIEQLCEVAPGSPGGWFEGDAVMIQQVLMNLCVNARDAIQGPGRLTVAVDQVTLDEDGARALGPNARPGMFARLQVSDSGTGMDTGTLRHIFDPFYTTKTDGKGTGLGLATVDGIVAQHRGFVVVESQPGQGSTFSVFLPAVAPPQPPAPQPLPLISPATQRLRVLLAEDEAMVRKVAAVSLTRLGHEVHTANNGAEALDIWAREGGRFDLLLTDMTMPGTLSGLDVGRRCRQDRPDLKVIIMSGYSLSLVNEDAFRAGGLTFVGKPFDLKDLLAAVQAVMSL